MNKLTIILIKLQGIQELIEDCDELAPDHKEAICALILRSECMIDDLIDAQEGVY